MMRSSQAALLTLLALELTCAQGCRFDWGHGFPHDGHDDDDHNCHLPDRDACDDADDNNGLITLREFTLEDPEEIEDGVRLGGFSGLTHVDGDPANVFYTVTDRGPNGLVGGRRTFPLESYSPNIVKIRLNTYSLEVLEETPIRRPDGELVSTRGNLSAFDEVPFDRSGTTMLPFDPHGLDPEGIEYNAADDTFWIAEEYESLVHVDRDGVILERLVAQGSSALLGTGYVRDAFPAYYTKRPRNRGFEGLSITPDGRFMFVVQQSPLNNPTAAVGAVSRVIRILKIDMNTSNAVGEYVYIGEDASKLTGVLQSDVSLSDVYAVDRDTLIVVERDRNPGPTAQLKRIYRVELGRATNVLNVSAVSSGTLESLTLDQLRAESIVPATKTLLVDILTAIPGFEHEKVEGLYVSDRTTLQFCIDNDFGVLYDGAAQSFTGQPTQCYRMKFSRSLY